MAPSRSFAKMKGEEREGERVYEAERDFADPLHLMLVVFHES